MTMATMATATARVAAAVLDAQASVGRESTAGIMTPRYTAEALHQMGWMRAYGERAAYRRAFADAFVLAWSARFAEGV
jgi:hypothetical protein